MEKRIRALKAIILVVVMIVELFGVDAVRVVAETINVTGDTTISTEDNRDYAVTDCTLTVSSTGNITGTVYGSGGKIVNQGSISKIERNIEVDNQAGASIQDLQSSVGITNAGYPECSKSWIFWQHCDSQHECRNDFFFECNKLFGDESGH